VGLKLVAFGQMERPVHPVRPVIRLARLEEAIHFHLEHHPVVHLEEAVLT